MNNSQSDSPDLANALHTLDLAGQDVDNPPFTIESISPSDVHQPTVQSMEYITLLEPFMNFTDPATALLSFVGHDIYCRQNSVDDPPCSIVDFGPKGVGLYDVIFRDLSEVEFPPLNVPGEGFSDKVSVRIRWPNHPDAEDKQINIRRSTREREYVKTYKILKKISELFLKFMIDQRDYEPPDGHFQWLFRPKGVIGLNNIVVQRILKVAPGSIQPVLACQIFEHEARLLNHFDRPFEDA